MPAVPSARPDDGQLNVLLGGAIDLRRTLILLPALLLGRHLGMDKVVTQPYRTLHIQADEPLPIAADGEFLGEVRELHLQVQAQALQVVRNPGMPRHSL